ncbi:MAG: fasciclin domain-containing protein [Raineya sp.]|nr:fasciclin domain-containing protein [Raineya sp.]MDW8297187.1 fasciclin domain-containing protein [Raineya sp.]
MFKNFFLLAILMFLFACKDDNNSQTPVNNLQDSTKAIQEQKPIANIQEAPTITDILNTGENFSMFASYLNTEYSKMLAEGEYTVLAPNNKAIESLGEAKMSKFVSQGASFIRRHIIKGKFDVKTLQKTSEITTLEGKKLKVRVEGDKITIGEVQVVAADITAKNGIIHAINKVLE